MTDSNCISGGDCAVAKFITAFDPLNFQSVEEFFCTSKYLNRFGKIAPFSVPLNFFIFYKCFWIFQQNHLKCGFCNKSFQKDEPLTSWTLFSTYLSSKLDFSSPMFWLEENLILSNVLIREESQYKIFDKPWSPHFVPFIHVKSGQNVATKFCQKLLYCDSTLGKNLSNFVPLVWKLHNPYCHNPNH